MNDCICVAMDTGGTKTHVLLADADGNLLCDFMLAGFGTARDDPAMLEGLARSLREHVSDASRCRVRAVVANLGGKNETQLYRTLAACFPNARINVYRESSGTLALEVGRVLNARTVLLAGTGVICVAEGAHGRFIADGWGQDIGDAGSGYWIGMRAISEALRALENPDAPLTPLAARITGCAAPFQPSSDPEEWMRRRDEVRACILPLSRAKAAAYTTVAADCARAGDEIARSVFGEAGACMADTVCRTRHAAGLEDACMLVMGGLTRCADLWVPAFRVAFRNRTGQEADLMIHQGDMTEGALRVAVEQARPLKEV